VKLVDPDGLTGSFPDGSPEQDAQWEKAMATRTPAEKLRYTSIDDLPETGPCNMRALIGVAEIYAGKNLSKNKLSKLITNLTTGSSPMVDKTKGYSVDSDVGVVGAALDELLGAGTSDKLNIEITRPDNKNYPSAKANAMYSLLEVGRRDNNSVPGHWQIGDSNGNFIWDPLSGRDTGGRKIFETKTRYVNITPK